MIRTKQEQFVKGRRRRRVFAWNGAESGPRRPTAPRPTRPRPLPAGSELDIFPIHRLRHQTKGGPRDSSPTRPSGRFFRKDQGCP